VSDIGPAVRSGLHITVHEAVRKEPTMLTEEELEQLLEKTLEPDEEQEGDEG
jgi:hypothetical protein